MVLAALAVAVLALILAIVAPAIGGKSGPSTKKLAKQLKAERAARQAQEAALEAQLSALQLKQGPAGPQGATGPRGAQGPGAVKVDYDQPQGASSGHTPVATAHELTVKAQCVPSGPETNAFIYLNSTVPATEHAVAFRDQDNGPVTTSPEVEGLSPGVDQISGVLNAFSGDGHFVRTQARATYRSDLRVLTLDLLIIANGSTDRCQVQGTIVPTG